MRFSIRLAISYIVVFIGAVLYVVGPVTATQSSLIVVFETGAETPQSYINEVKSFISNKLQGEITYEYDFVLTGFSVSLPQALVEQVSAQGKNKNVEIKNVFKPVQNKKYPLLLEWDQEVNLAQGASNEAY